MLKLFLKVYATGFKQIEWSSAFINDYAQFNNKVEHLINQEYGCERFILFSLMF
jgi:hypothetical protein